MGQKGHRDGGIRGRVGMNRQAHRRGKSGKMEVDVATVDEDLLFVATVVGGERGKTVARTKRVIGHRLAILEHEEIDGDSGIERRARETWRSGSGANEREIDGKWPGVRERERERARETETVRERGREWEWWAVKAERKKR